MRRGVLLSATIVCACARILQFGAESYELLWSKCFGYRRRPNGLVSCYSISVLVFCLRFNSMRHTCSCRQPISLVRCSFPSRPDRIRGSCRLTNDPLAMVDAVEVTCFSTPTSHQLDIKLNYDSAAALPFLLLTARDFY